jgi:serine kinase of HPr protein (carbohydrate metabolism regulator)
MTVQLLADKLSLNILCGGKLADKPVTGCYCGDLLSWVMSRAKSGDAWLTVMGNINSVGVAVLADIACIILTENAAFDAPALEKAQQNDVIVLQTPKHTYEIAAAIASLFA